MIEVENLTKRFGNKTAVDAVSFRVEPGRVTGFLGPNGAGKSTTMRMLVGLDRPTSGTSRVNGRPYVQHRAPLREAGALLEAKAVHPGRTAYDHLRAMAATHHIPGTRVDEVIELTGLSAVARKRVRGFSLGMGQRLGIAHALLGDPQTVIMDEPINGLDPEGVAWVRRMLRHLADEGRTVFLSSHLMSELALVADDVIVIGRGRIIASGAVEDVISGVAAASVRVRSPRAHELSGRLAGDGVTISTEDPHTLSVRGLAIEQIGEIAAAGGIPLHELTAQSASLEEAFMTLTADEVEYPSLPAPTIGASA